MHSQPTQYSTSNSKFFQIFFNYPKFRYFLNFCWKFNMFSARGPFGSNFHEIVNTPENAITLFEFRLFHVLLNRVFGFVVRSPDFYPKNILWETLPIEIWMYMQDSTSPDVWPQQFAKIIRSLNAKLSFWVKCNLKPSVANPETMPSFRIFFATKLQQF